MPTMNAGITWTTVRKPVIARSTQVVRRSAASVPRAKPDDDADDQGQRRDREAHAETRPMSV